MKLIMHKEMPSYSNLASQSLDSLSHNISQVTQTFHHSLDEMQDHNNDNDKNYALSMALIGVFTILPMILLGIRCFWDNYLKKKDNRHVNRQNVNMADYGFLRCQLCEINKRNGLPSYENALLLPKNKGNKEIEVPTYDQVLSEYKEISPGLYRCNNSLVDDDFYMI